MCGYLLLWCICAIAYLNVASIRKMSLHISIYFSSLFTTLHRFTSSVLLCPTNYLVLNLHQRKSWHRKRKSRHAQKACYKVFAPLQISWQKSLRNLESHSLKNDRCSIISHNLETFLWKQKLFGLFSLCSWLEFKLYFWVCLHMCKHALVGTGLSTLLSLSMEHITE